MKSTDRLQNFVFRGLLLDASLGNFADSGLELRGDIAKTEDNSKRISIDDFPMDLRMGAVKNSYIYTAFFCFENSVRNLVSARLIESKGPNWWNTCTPTSIKKKVEERMSKDKKNKWHAPRASDEISYCDFGDLSNIIQSNWVEFEDLFPSQDWIKTRLDDLEPSRNALAHSNVLEDQDVNRIAMYLKDWLSQVG